MGTAISANRGPLHTENALAVLNTVEQNMHKTAQNELLAYMLDD